MIISSPLPSGRPISDIGVIEADGRSLVVVAEYGGAWTWDPAGDVWAKAPLRPHFDEYPDADPDFDCVAAAPHGDRLVIVGGSENHAMAAWDLRTGEVLRQVDEEDDPVTAVAAARIDGATVFASGDYGGGLALWDPSEAEPAELAVDHEEAILDLAAGTAGDRPALIAGGYDGMVGVWDLRTRRRTAWWRAGDGEPVRGVALTRLGDRPVAVAGGDGGEVRVWALDGDRPLLATLPAHPDPINALDAATVGGRPLAVTGSEDGTVRIWDLAEGAQVGDPLPGAAESVLITSLDGRPTVLAEGPGGVIQAHPLT
ncbi:MULTISPECIES: WD40 repeat domain-containing protein [Actinomadura]|uniref:WD40 repeat domain-containing protein n=1 Tax=Actinomadura TaxID=1988 RepID=UPI0004009305|nr:MULTISPECIES: WD40 repeat domain-containing protein [Actinomadura]RSN52192.1 WD40 repeat domain-containing protein [Actinomadura sp. WAC 06369]